MKLNKFTGVIGAPRTGKTTYMLKIANEICKEKKVIYLTPHNIPSQNFEVINPNLYKPKIIEKYLCEKASNSLIIFDEPLLCECVDNRGTILYKLAATRGNQKNDIIIMAHSFNHLPPRIPGLLESCMLFAACEQKIEEKKKPAFLLNKVILKQNSNIFNYKSLTFEQIYLKILKKCNFETEKLTYLKHYIYAR